MAPSEKKYILFDLDGTLTDPFEGITKSVQYALNHFDIQVTDLTQLTKFIGPPLHQSFMEYYNLDSQQSHQAVVKYRERFAEIGIFENKVFEGIDELLKDLKAQNKKIIMATSKPEVYAIRIAEHYDFAKYFDLIVGSFLDGKRQAKSEVIEYIIRAQNIESVDEAIMIGDRLHDIKGAKHHNMETIGVSFGYGGTKELELAGATYIVDTVEQLRQLLI